MSPEIEKLAAIADRNETSFFQITYFLIGQEPTDQAKLHKCIHEMSGRLKSIKAVELELADISDLIELQTLEMNKLESSEEGVIRKRMMSRKIHSHVEQSHRLEEKKEAWAREIGYLYQIYRAVAERTPLKPWGSYDVQLEYWNQKLQNEIRARILLHAPVDLETMKVVMSLPDATPVKQEILQQLSAKATTFEI